MQQNGSSDDLLFCCKIFRSLPPSIISAALRADSQSFRVPPA